MLPYLIGGGRRRTDGYDIERGLLCDGSSSASRVVGAGASRRTFTVEGWFKRADLGSLNAIIGIYNGFSSFASRLYLDTSDRLAFDFGGASANTTATAARFRDPSAFMHVRFTLDTTQAVAADRVVFEVNGERLTTFDTTAYPSQNADSQFGITGQTLSLFRRSADEFSGVATHIRYLDGINTDASDFGEVRPGTNDFWQPKAYAGLYGADGWFLPFSNNASTTTLGEDASGNGNDWTLTGFTVDDSVEDTPTRNFPTLNPLETRHTSAPSDGNLRFAPSGTSPQLAIASSPVPSEGQWYAECTKGDSNANWPVGLTGPSRTDTYLGQTDGIAYWAGGSIFENNSSTQPGLASVSTGDVVGMAVDADAQTIQFYVNGTPQGTPVSYAGKSSVWWACGNYVSGLIYDWNFGQKPFAHTPPAGFKALSTANLSNPDELSPLTGTFTGNASADGPFVYLGYPPDQTGVCTINSNTITWGTHADALANGFKLRTASSSYNAAGSNSYSIAIDPDASFADNANAQVN